MHIKHYIYAYPVFKSDGTLVKEEFELWDGDVLVSTHNTNPDPTLPVEIIVD